MDESCNVSRADSSVTVFDLCTPDNSDEGSDAADKDLQPCTRPVQRNSGRWLPACTPKLNGHTLKRALTPRMPKRIAIRGGAISRAARQCLPCCLSEPKVSDPDSPRPRRTSGSSSGGTRCLRIVGRAQGAQEFPAPEGWENAADAPYAGADSSPEQSREIAGHCEHGGPDSPLSGKSRSDRLDGMVAGEGVTKSILHEAGKLLGDVSSQELAAAVCQLSHQTEAFEDGVADADTTIDTSTEESASPSSYLVDTALDAATEGSSSPSCQESLTHGGGSGDLTSAVHGVSGAAPDKTPSADEVQPSGAKARGSSRGRPPVGRAPPPRRSHSELSRGQSPGPGGALPDWCGPRPPPNWKAERIVNWQPIRQVGRWEGSVWQTVNTRMQENGFTPLPDSLLNQAFMRNVEDPMTPRSQRSASQARSTKRRLSQRAALTADLLYAQLNRRGIESPGQLAWVTGPQCAEEVFARASGSDAAADRKQVGKELPEDILETLQGLLRAAVGEEGKLLKTDDDSNELQLAPAEAFLQCLLAEAGPLKLLRPRVDLALNITRMPAEVAELEGELRMGISAAHAVLKSAAMPVLLEGVLLLGNYVNAGSKSLSGAVGVTMESLTKLAHTRCLPQQSQEGGTQSFRDRHQHGNAFLLLVQHIQQRWPGFVEVLRRDLEGCRAARDLDPEAMTGALGSLNSRAEEVKECISGRGPCPSIVSGGSEASTLPEALKERRLQQFLQGIAPCLQAVEQLSKEFADITLALRRWFAESEHTGFSDMMRCLATLREALPPPPKQAALPLQPRSSSSRQVREKATPGQRAQSEPRTGIDNGRSSSASAVRRRCKSAPPTCCFNGLHETPSDCAPLAGVHPQKLANPDLQKLATAVSSARATHEVAQRCVVTQPQQPHPGRKLRPLPSPRAVSNPGRKLRPLPSPRDVSDVRRQLELSKSKAPAASPRTNEKTLGTSQETADEVPATLPSPPCSSSSPSLSSSSSPPSKLAPLPTFVPKAEPPAQSMPLTSAPLGGFQEQGNSCTVENDKAASRQVHVTLPQASSTHGLSGCPDASSLEQSSKDGLTGSNGGPVQVELPLEFGAPEVIAPTEAARIVVPTVRSEDAIPSVVQVALPLEFSMPLLSAH